MNTRDLSSLILLSAIWGSSFLFMRIAAPVLGPIWLISARVGIAGIALVLYCYALKNVPEFRSRWREFAFMGAINSALPFTLISWAELHITASLAVTLNAAVPMFTAVVSALWLGEKFSLERKFGLGLGMVGVAILVGLGPLELTPLVLVSVGAVLGATLCYAIAGNFVKRNMSGVSPLATTTYSQVLGTLPLLLLMPFTAPDNLESKLASSGTFLILGSALALALVCTAVAYLIYFQLIRNIGPLKTSMVTYLAPVFGIAWGVIFLQEKLNWGSVLGFAVILSSVALVSGVVKLGKAGVVKDSRVG